MSRKLLGALVAAAFLVVPATAWSFKLQKPEMTNKGTFTFGGGLNLAFLTDTIEIDGVDGDAEVSRSTIGIAPQIGYFAMDNLEIGVLLDYHSSTTEPDGGDAVETSGYAVGAGVAYYFNFMEKNALYPYVGASVRYQSDTPAEDVTVSGTDIRPGVGLMLAVGSRTGGFMKLGLDYQILSLSTENDGDEVSTTSTSGVVVGLGFGLYLQ